MTRDYQQITNKERIVELLTEADLIYSKNKESNNKNKDWGDKDKDDKLKNLHLLKKELDSLVIEKNEYQKLIEETELKNEIDILKSELDNASEREDEILKKAEEIVLQEKAVKDNCVIEIRPGAGGIEAGLFARDLYQMYYRFCEEKKWKVEIVEARSDSLGNFSFVSFLVKGKRAYQLLRNESGVHRVQRVPITESKGRLQTSTVSIVVLPEIDDIAVKVDPRDLKIDTYRSGGAGGQHVNTTDSAIRITHIPTGVVATSQDGRSQHDNKEKALFILKSRLFERYKNQQTNELGNIRSSAIGSGERSEKIRTYNYPQNRVTDHRIGLTINKLNSIIQGDIEEICKQLIIFEAEQKLAGFIENELKK